jgi:hypothetical protein
MRRLLRVLLVGCAISLAVPASPAHPPKGRLYFLGVAYDAAPPANKTLDHYNYAPDNFSDLLVERSSPLFRDVRVEDLKGSRVTREAVLAKLRSMQPVLNEDDLVFFYWGTHGGVDPQKGWNAELADGGLMYGADIKRELGRLPCPVIAVISTCGSGGFADRVSAADAKLPNNVTAFCACRPSQSTGNDLDVSLCEALAGFADFDKSGDVTLREALSYVPRRYRYWRQGAFSDQMPVLDKGLPSSLDAPLAKVTRDYAAVVKDGAWYGAAVVKRETGRVKMRFLGFDRTCADGTYSRPDEFFEEEAIDWPGSEPPIEVEWNGAWWPARIIGREGDRLRIHYINYPASDDETVGADRVRYPFPSSAARR